MMTNKISLVNGLNIIILLLGLLFQHGMVKADNSIAIPVSGIPSYSITTLFNPPRLVVDVKKAC